VTKGSDCPTGKRQFASKAAARDAAGGLRARGGYPAVFRCAWCQTWHVGNRPAHTSKNRGRR
jgi:hypothetical protein